VQKQRVYHGKRARGSLAGLAWLFLIWWAFKGEEVRWTINAKAVAFLFNQRIPAGRKDALPADSPNGVLRNLARLLNKGCASQGYDIIDCVHNRKMTINLSLRKTNQHA
jgi:uncharacterized membrane protein